MKINITLICGLLFGLLTLSSCGNQKKTMGNYTFKTACLRTNLDGSQSLIAWGNG